MNECTNIPRLCAVMSVFLAIVILISYSFSLFTYPDADYIDAMTGSERLTVIIDPGHGGEDCGAIGYTGVYEKDLNMQIALKLGDYLTSAGISVIYTRTEDKLLYTEDENIKGMRKIYDLRNRAKIANAYDTNALFVSIHMNSFGAKECKGMQIYHADNTSSRDAAENIRAEVVSKLQQDNHRALKGASGLYLLENIKMPAVLIECGFVSNPDECRVLSDKEYQKEFSFAVLSGILKYENTASD